MADKQNVAPNENEKIQQDSAVKGVSMTLDNIQELAGVITDAVNEYAKKETEKGIVDIMLLYAALGHVGFRAGLEVFSNQRDKVEPMYNEVRTLANELLRKIDALSVEKPISPGVDIITMSHLLSVLGELYAKRRDNFMKDIETVS